MRPRILDLFCGAGGAAMGYHRAGFDVVGVDIEPQPNYPFRFVQADALDYLAAVGMTLSEEYAAVHASPPCHDWSPLASVTGVDGTGDLLLHTLSMLQAVDVPWVVENTMGAPLAEQPTLDGRHGVVLCGTMFGLQVIRHRLFEASVPLVAPAHGSHVGEFYTPAGHGDPNWRQRPLHPHRSGQGYADRCRRAMDIDWMNRDELAQAIPPAYTEWIGTQLLAHLGVAA